MKKIIAVFSLLLILVSGCSCKDKEIEKFYLEEKYYNRDTQTSPYIHVESYDEIQSLIDNDESFALLIYETSCAASSAFITVLNEYLEEKGLIFYNIRMWDVQLKAPNVISDNVKYRPSLAIFNEGEYVTSLRADLEEHKEYYMSASKFGEWFETYVKLDIEEANQ